MINRRQFRGCGVAAAVCVALALASLVHADTGLAFEPGFEAPVFTPGILVSDPNWSFDSALLTVEVIVSDSVSPDDANQLQWEAFIERAVKTLNKTSADIHVGHLEGRHSKRAQATDQCPEHMDRATAKHGSAASSQQIHLNHKPTNNSNNSNNA